MSTVAPDPSSQPAPGQKQFPCQACGAKLTFQPGTAVLKCPYCAHENAIPQSEEQIQELDYRAALTDLAHHSDTAQALTVRCEACAAQTTLPPAITAAACPFCGANIVATAQATTVLKPKAVLPFAINRDQAMGYFRQWMNSLWFAPNDLKRMALADNRFAGMYVPYWTYDSDTTSFYRGERGDDYWVTERYQAYENGKWVTRTRQVRRTRWTAVSGTVWNQFNDVLVLASRSLPRDLAESLEPWDLPALVPYADEYLSGFRAEAYQIGLEEGFDIARGIMDGPIRQSIAFDIGGDHQRIHSVKTRYDRVTFKHILLPVWLSAYRYRERVFRFLVNARTGEVQGERPYSPWKIAFLVVLLLLAVAAAVGLFMLMQNQ